MASILLPNAERYNLASLGQLLGVPITADHRGINDAQVTRAVYQHLQQIALNLPLRLLADIIAYAEKVEWNGYNGFYNVLRMRSKEVISAKQAREGYFGPLFDQYTTRNLSPLTPNSELYALNPDEVAAILEYGGAFANHFPQYEYRPQQIAMLRAITHALSLSRHLLVEAGTGTGKSFA